MKRMFYALIVVFCLIAVFPIGFRMAMLFKANRAVGPVIKAVEAYKSRTGHLPSSLENISTDLKGVPMSLSSSHGLVWSVNYRITSGQSYCVSFNSAHYDVNYWDGGKGELRFNPFR